ncbi:MAG: DotA/TraY family protein [Betaproteobacteria bacterium]|nr:DotA/TraY family protein [Betaproteobacteria bacterium]
MPDPTFNCATGTASGSINVLQNLIPTNQADIAVQQYLIPIFGKAVAEKVPCTSSGDLISIPMQEQSELITALFSTYAGGIALFGTFIVIFFSIAGLVKTAHDGELFGKSWNTTWSIARLLSGAAMLAPLPNGLMVIQNIVLLVALWASGLANQATNAMADYHLKTLFAHLAGQSPTVQSLRDDAFNILKMHVCAKLVNQQYSKQNARLAMQTENKDNGETWYGYQEQGDYLAKGIYHCGAYVIQAAPAQAPADDAAAPGEFQLESTRFPLSVALRKNLKIETQKMADEVRNVRKTIGEQMASEGGSLAGLADRIVGVYRDAQIQFDDNGKVSSTGNAGAFSAVVVIAFLKDFNNTVKALDEQVYNTIKTTYQTLVSSSDNNFFKKMRESFTSGGWMGLGSNYQMMYLVSSITNFASKQSYQRFDPAGRNALIANSPQIGGLGDRINTLDLAVDGAAAQVGASSIGLGDRENKALALCNKATKPTETIKTKADAFLQTQYKPFSEVFSNVVGAVPNNIACAMILDPNGDPLMQIKRLGDQLATSSEELFTKKYAMDKTVAYLMSEDAKKVLTPKRANEEAESAKASDQSISTFLTPISMAITGMSYAFSTWIPMIPTVSFFFGSIGFIIAVVMTVIALPLWAAMHMTPTRNDSFIGSQTQGYLMLLSVMFRPLLTVMGLVFSFVLISPMLLGLNTLIVPAMIANETIAGSATFFLLTVFQLILYWFIAQALITWCFTLPQGLPDQVLKVISAGTGDLGENRALSTAESSGTRAGAAAQSVLGQMRR